MTRKTKAGKIDPSIRALAYKLIADLPPKAFRAEADMLFRYVRDNVRYVRDINGVETLADAAQVLRQGQGDCDDKSVLLASLLESAGHPTRFKAVGFNAGQLSHVYVETLIGNTWVPMDATERAPMGWSPPGVVNSMIQDN